MMSSSSSSLSSEQSCYYVPRYRLQYHHHSRERRSSSSRTSRRTDYNVASTRFVSSNVTLVRIHLTSTRFLARWRPTRTAATVSFSHPRASSLPRRCRRVPPRLVLVSPLLRSRRPKARLLLPRLYSPRVRPRRTRARSFGTLDSIVSLPSISPNSFC